MLSSHIKQQNRERHNNSVVRHTQENRPNITNNNFKMKRKQLLKIYCQMQGHLQKKSLNFFIGYQPKLWKVLQNGTKIGYRNINETVFDNQKIYELTHVETGQAEEDCCFLLNTTRRVFELRAESEAQRKQWMRAITYLKKEITRKKKRETELPKKRNNILTLINDSTLPSIAVTQIQQNLVHSQPIARMTHMNTSKLSSQYSPSRTMLDDDGKDKFSEYLKKMPQSYSQYHVFITKLKKKQKQLFMTTNHPSYYILFSSKSLFPEQFINQQNLTSAQLPHWAEVDGFYKLGQQKNNCKLIFQLAHIKQIQNVKSHCSLIITTAEDKLQFLCQNLESRERLKIILQTGRINALQSTGQFNKRNFDSLVILHSYNLQQFNFMVRKMIEPLTPAHHQFQPEVIKKFIDNISPLLIEVIAVLQKKVTLAQDSIIDFIKVVHQDVRITLKLVWDTSSAKAKGGDVLNILKSVAKYQALVNKYVKDKQFFQAMKQLSKIYVRCCYKNFQSIILSIVEQQKGKNYYLTEQSQSGQAQYLQTHSITDLFKFIYDVFDLAIPCWNNKLHLHNIHRLIKQALNTFVKELKAMVDEQDLQMQTLVGIANNYVRFSQQVDEFYQDKLSQLKEQTRQFYDSLRDQYREISMLVLDKLTLPLKIQLKVYFQTQMFYSVSMEEPFNMISKSDIVRILGKVHFVFRKRCFQRIFGTLREEFCKMLQKQAKKIGKKKPEISKILQKLHLLNKDCQQMIQLLGNGNIRLKIQRQISELQTLLTSNRKQQIKLILSESNQFFRRIYYRILHFRQDYSEGSSLYAFLQIIQNDQFRRNLGVQKAKQQRRTSFSKQYIQQFDRSSISSSIQKQKQLPSDDKIKMISQGFVMRGKQNGSYQRIYFKIKKQVLYIYENERMERCQNTVQIQDMVGIKVPNPEKTVFIISFTAVGRTKEMKIKCEGEEMKRWIYSLQQEMRRLANERKVKSKGIKVKEKKSKLIIDYEQALNGPDYFSYQE